MKHTGLLKFLLVIFVIVAVFNYRGDTLNEWAIKTGMFLRGFSTSSVSASDTDKMPVKVEDKNTKLKHSEAKVTAEVKQIPQLSSNDNSVVGTFIASVLNKLLETPNGQVLLQESISRASSRNKYNQGTDIAERKYLSVDSLVGKGNEVKCGDEIEITYNVYKQSDKDIKNKKQLRTRIVVGHNSLAKPLEGALIGMREGGKKRVLYFVEDIFKVSKKKTNKADYQQLISEVHLEKIHSPKMDAKNKVRVFVHNPSRIGKRVACGDDIDFTYKVTDMDNNILSDQILPNRITLNVYKDPRSPLRDIYNNLVDTYMDHVRLTAILRYDQAKQFVPGLTNSRNGGTPNGSLVILDLYGTPKASLQDMQTDALLNKMMNPGLRK